MRRRGGQRHKYRLLASLLQQAAAHRLLGVDRTPGQDIMAAEPIRRAFQGNAGNSVQPDLSVIIVSREG